MQEAAQKEIEEAMKKVKEAQSLITAAADSGTEHLVQSWTLVVYVPFCLKKNLFYAIFITYHGDQSIKPGILGSPKLAYQIL